MSYYQGDFYQGDPGFLSFLGGAVKKIGGFATKFLGEGGGGGGGGASMPGGSIIRQVRPILQRAGGAIVKHPVLSAAGAAGTIGLAGAGVGRRTGRMGAAGVGPATLPGLRGAGGAFGRKRRRMHVTNVKALRRAIRRATGFAHLAKRVLRFTSPRPPRGRAVFKHRRRKKIV